MADGRLNKCKACTKKDVAEHRELNIEKIRGYDRERAKLPHRIAKMKLLVAKRAKLYPHWVKANGLTSNALRDGRIKPEPCFVCGAEKVEAHHPDYSSPLDVVWLCIPHHRQLHAQARIREVSHAL
jgi:hypothetical protein